jgi:hypothetical protein
MSKLNKAFLIKTDGTITEVVPKKKNDISFGECYPLIDCQTIEIVRVSNDVIMLIDEEGRFNSEINPIATRMYKETHMCSEDSIVILKAQWGDNVIVVEPNDGTDVDGIYGNVILCPDNWVK